LGQDHFPPFQQNHGDNKQKKYGIQKQHDGPVLTIGIRIAPGKEELAGKEIHQQHNECYEQAHVAVAVAQLLPNEKEKEG
jgi:hypothetical protein